MDFAKEYIGKWISNKEYEYAQLLWLWYDYHTEMYDKNLNHVISPYDETSVIPIGHYAQIASGKNAIKIYSEIDNIAKHYEISNKMMMDAKNDYQRNRQSIQYRIELFIEFEKQGKFDFIYNVV